MPDSTEHELAIFSAVRQLTPERQSTFLDEACAGDPILRQRVEELVQAAAKTATFMAQPSLAPP